jgi:hypothetical protein
MQLQVWNNLFRPDKVGYWEIGSETAERREIKRRAWACEKVRK